MSKRIAKVQGRQRVGNLSNGGDINGIDHAGKAVFDSKENEIVASPQHSTSNGVKLADEETSSIDKHDSTHSVPNGINGVNGSPHGDHPPNCNGAENPQKVRHDKVLKDSGNIPSNDHTLPINLANLALSDTPVTNGIEMSTKMVVTNGDHGSTMANHEAVVAPQDTLLAKKRVEFI